MSIISISPASRGEKSAASLVEHLGERLSIKPRRGNDGTWEFPFHVSYAVAHAAVVNALNEADPRWPVRVTVEYALTI